MNQRRPRRSIGHDPFDGLRPVRGNGLAAPRDILIGPLAARGTRNQRLLHVLKDALTQHSGSLVLDCLDRLVGDLFQLPAYRSETTTGHAETRGNMPRPKFFKLVPPCLLVVMGVLVEDRGRECEFREHQLNLS